jgi:hypothetical protein
MYGHMPPRPMLPRIILFLIGKQGQMRTSEARSSNSLAIAGNFDGRARTRATGRPTSSKIIAAVDDHRRDTSVTHDAPKARAECQCTKSSLRQAPHIHNMRSTWFKPKENHARPTLSRNYRTLPLAGSPSDLRPHMSSSSEWL